MLTRVALVISALFLGKILGKRFCYFTSLSLLLIFVSSFWFVMSPHIYFLHFAKSGAIRSVQPHPDRLLPYPSAPSCFFTYTIMLLWGSQWRLTVNLLTFSTVYLFSLRLTKFFEINCHCFKRLKINFHCFKKLKICLDYWKTHLGLRAI